MKLSEGQTRDLLRDARDEMFAAMVYIVDWGKIELGTPQTARLRAMIDRLSEATGHEPKLPKGYPMNQN